MKRSAFLRKILAATSVPGFIATAKASDRTLASDTANGSGTVCGPKPTGTSGENRLFGSAESSGTGMPPISSHGLKLSLNAYSFNDPLSKGTLKPEDLLKFCSNQGFDAIDMTGYYFRGYPAVPTDETIFNFKRIALAHGIALSGTGVRNDFTNEDPKIRAAHVNVVKEWIEVAAKLGAPVLRIFTGLQYPDKASRPKCNDMVVEHILQCLDKAKAYGIVLAIQNHHDFIRTSEEAINILKAVNSPWLGLVLDIGSYRGADPFGDIEKSIPYAVNWQVKEKMYVNGEEQVTDLKKLFRLIKASGYRGYLPIETLGAGDPFQKTTTFLKQVKTALA